MRPRPPRSFAFTYKRSILLYADPTVSHDLSEPPCLPPGLSPLFAFPERATSCAAPRPRPAGMRHSTRILL
ncbi:hypothetical protein STEG23_037439, partial [Scotinomys teguina]